MRHSEKEKEPDIDKCWECKQRQPVIARVSMDEGNKAITQNLIGACQNRKCFRHTNLKEVRTWEVVRGHEYVRN